MFTQLGFGEPKPSRISIPLVDSSIKYPKGITEDVHVKVDKFIFHVDFITLDMMRILRTVIDVDNGELVLRVGDEEVTLQARDAMRVSSKRYDTCYSINVSNHAAQHSLQEITYEYVLKSYPFQCDKKSRDE
ncbi:Aspartic peptidase [Gossypium australe]|uniref:Aspartic peptidase n=1 Tax=Gossypium australe TaxID=47621 RepID=A0A5B6VW11_9ROSI|nr:Aspartic peptidase [Gossypium australe]